VEVKTSGYPEDWGSEGTDQIPLEIRLQCQQQLSVMRCFQPKMALNYVPVFFLPNREHRIYCVEHSPELEEAIIYAGESFWTDNVEAGVAPEFDTSSESAAKYIAAVCHQTSRAIVKAPPAADQWIEQLTQANIAIDVAERFKNAAEYQLRKLVGANKGIEGDWGRYLWYMRQSGGTDWKALAQEMFAVLRAAGIGNVQGQAKLIENHQRPGTRVPRFTPRKGEG
jgi:predicted phage-related endonuclease